MICRLDSKLVVDVNRLLKPPLLFQQQRFFQFELYVE